MSGAAPTSHVPAWRKLGLKLKYAKDVPDQRPVSATEKQRQQSPPNGVEATNGTKKRKLSSLEPGLGTESTSKRINGHVEKSRAPKESKHSPPPRTSSTDAVVTEKLGKTRQVTPPPSKPTGKQRRQKSVSFTPETKTKDGTSAQEIFDSWRPDQDVDDGSLGQSDTQKLADETEARKKSKKPKKSKSTLLENQKLNGNVSEVKINKSDSEQGSTESSPILKYLDAFQNSRASWKFNKARQNQLFKHVLDVEKIPQTYSEALLEYLDGLQGQASRNQLRERAIQVREQDTKDGLEDDKMSSDDTTMRDQSDRVSTDEERHKAAYRNAVRKFKAKAKWDAILEEEEDLQMSKEWKMRLERRRRGEQMLQMLGEENTETKSETTVNTPQRVKTGVDFEVSRTLEKSTDQNGNVVGQKKKRKRKRRTAMPVDDSSSDESSSSSSDSDDDVAMGKEDADKLRQFVNDGGNVGGDPSDSESESGSSSSSSSDSGDDGSNEMGHSGGGNGLGSDAESSSSGEGSSDSD